MHDFNKSDRETMNAKQKIIDTWGFNWKETMNLAVVNETFYLTDHLENSRFSTETVGRHLEGAYDRI